MSKEVSYKTVAGILLLIITLGVIVSLTGELGRTEPENTQVSADDLSGAESAKKLRLNSSDTRAEQDTAISYTKSIPDSPYPAAQATKAMTSTEETVSAMPSTQAANMLAEAREELRFNEGFSTINLMLLKDLASRLNTQAAQQQTGGTEEFQTLMADWPGEFSDALLRMLAANQAEATLYKDSQQLAGQDPQAFREAYLKQQKELLGDTLFQKLHAEDVMQVDEAGLSAHFESPSHNEQWEQSTGPKSKAQKETVQLLQQWQEDKVSETELRSALAQNLRETEIDQLIDTATHEANWLNQIAAFLDEYRYIEQAGIVGEDELQMRTELMAKHFSAENRAIANQFLFGAQPGSP